jgi:hypothetical protein
MIESMHDRTGTARDWIDWLVPIGTGSVLTVAAVLIGDSLGWSDGVSGVVALVGVIVGVTLRLAIHDYDREQQRERVVRG